MEFVISHHRDGMTRITIKGDQSVSIKPMETDKFCVEVWEVLQKRGCTLRSISSKRNQNTWWPVYLECCQIVANNRLLSTGLRMRNEHVG